MTLEEVDEKLADLKRKRDTHRSKAYYWHVFNDQMKELLPYQYKLRKKHDQAKEREKKMRHKLSAEWFDNEKDEEQYDTELESRAYRVDSILENLADLSPHVHVTAKGQEIPIYKLDKEHLLNIISLHMRRMRDAFNGSVASTSLLDEVMGNGEARKMRVADLKKYIQYAYAITSRYIFEAYRRGLNNEVWGHVLLFNSMMDTLSGKPVNEQLVAPIQVIEVDKSEN